MATCPRCGSDIISADDGLCPFCGDRLSAESVSPDEQRHDSEPTPIPPQPHGMWRVWVSLIVFSSIVAAFFGLVGLARLENAAGSAESRSSGMGSGIVIPSRQDTTVPELDVRRVLVVVSEQVDGNIRSGDALAGLIRDRLETAGFEPVDSAEQSSLRVQARRAGSAMFVNCTVRATSRDGVDISGVPYTRISMTADLQVHLTDSSRALFARKASGHAMGVDVETAIEAAHDKVTRPLLDKAVARLAPMLDGKIGPSDLTEPAVQDSQRM